MSTRELVVLGTASQTPTRERNHNGYLLRWDGEGLLFDPGEGTQRQMLLAGVKASEITRICLTHLHGDHCLGLPGVLMRLSLDRIEHPIEACYPAESHSTFQQLRTVALFHDLVRLRERPVRGAETITEGPPFRLETRPLSHTVPALGYRLAEPDGPVVVHCAGGKDRTGLVCALALLLSRPRQIVRVDDEGQIVPGPSGTSPGAERS